MMIYDKDGEWMWQKQGATLQRLAKKLAEHGWIVDRRGIFTVKGANKRDEECVRWECNARHKDHGSCRIISYDTATACCLGMEIHRTRGLNEFAAYS